MLGRKPIDGGRLVRRLEETSRRCSDVILPMAAGSCVSWGGGSAGSIGQFSVIIRPSVDQSAIIPGHYLCSHSDTTDRLID